MDTNGKVTIVSSTQLPHIVRRVTAQALGIPVGKVRVIKPCLLYTSMLTPEAQNIALDSMAAIPVIDFSLLDPELTKSIEELKIEKFRIGSLGNLGTELYEEWDKQIGTLE